MLLGILFYIYILKNVIFLKPLNFVGEEKGENFSLYTFLTFLEIWGISLSPSFFSFFFFNQGLTLKFSGSVSSANPRKEVKLEGTVNSPL